MIYSFKFAKWVVLLAGLSVGLPDVSVEQKSTYEAYISGQNSLWDRAMKIKQRAYEANPSHENRFELTVTQYGLLGFTLKDQNEDLFDGLVDETVEHLEYLIDHEFKSAECHAMMSSIYGYKIAYDSWKGILFGSKASRLAEKAIEENPESALAWKLYGANKHFTPGAFGGDLEEAVKAYEKALVLWDASGDSDLNWLYLDTQAWLGQAYSSREQHQKAIAVYRDALERESDFAWVKYALLPTTEKLASK